MYKLSAVDAADLIGVAVILETLEPRVPARKSTLLHELVLALFRLPQATPGIDIEVGLGAARRWWSLGIDETEISLRAGNVIRLEEGRDTDGVSSWTYRADTVPNKRGEGALEALASLADAVTTRLTMMLDGAVQAQRRDVTRAIRARLGAALDPQVARVVYWHSATTCRFEIFRRDSKSPVGFLSRDLSLFASVSPTRSFAANLRALTADAKASGYFATAVRELFQPIGAAT
jgi:hypothetical protein